MVLASLVPGNVLAQVARVGAWTTGLTHTPGAGSNRVLIFAAGYENAASTDIGISSVTFGGRPLTRIAGESAGTTNRNRAELWYLNAAGIAAASGTTFVVTWTPSTPANVMFAAATYANVDQASPIEDFDSTFTNAATPNPITLTMTKSANGMVIGNFVCGNTGSYTWNNSFAEGFDQVAAATTTLSGGDQAQSTGGTVVVSATHSGPNRQAVAAASLHGAVTNQPPVLALIGPKSVNEGVLLTFNTSATDPDGTIPTFTSSTLPTGATYTNNGNGTATFNWTPTFSQSGAYNVTFRATDGSLVDTEIVTITVNNVNQPPDQLPIGAKSVNEGGNLNFLVTATDPDGTIPTLSSSTLPTGATYTLNGNGTATFNWTPTFTQSGSYPVTFRATDGILMDSEIVTITVNNVNRPPDQQPIGAKSVNENVLLTFTVTSTDPDGGTLTLTSSAVPTGATYTNNGNNTGTFNWTPNFTQSGSYNVTFRTSDGTLTDSEVVTITVNNVNQPPDQLPIGAKSVNEAVNLNFLVTATDPDGTTPTLSSSPLPTGSTYTLNGNGTATFNWTPTLTQSGLYPVTFRATDGTLTDSEIVTITVIDVSQPPVLAPIGPRSVTEGANLNFLISATDPDGTTPTFTSSTLPTGATLTGNGNGTATFNWTPSFVQAAVYSIVFRATDGSSVDTEIVPITVNEAGNQPPDQLTIGPKSVNEGATLSFVVTATDPDGTIPTLTSSALPTGSTYTPNGNGTATFNWTPNFTQSGSYPVTFRATDGVLMDTEVVTITVNNVNQPPDQLPIGAKSVNEGVLLTFNTSATDPDGTIPTFTSSTVPTGATYTNNGNGTATFNWTPTFSQSGAYNVTFRATDGSLVDTEIVTITVSNVNQPPDQLPIGAKSVNEGGNLNFLVTATDPDGTTPTLSSSTLPTGATYTLGSGTGTFNWTPTFSQSGSYLVTFRATDGTLTDSEIVTITVNNVNQPPDQLPIGAKSVNEGGNLNFLVTATDPDGTTPTLSSSTLPTGATYTLNGNGTATFNWTPNFSQSGSYPVTFRATDGTLMDTEIVTITVNNVNQPPDQLPIGAKSVNEGGNLNFLVTATDPDGTTPTLSSSTLPTGSTYTLNGNGTATFNWTPTFSQSGSYPVTFRATDGTFSDSEIVTITVINVNQPPDQLPIGAKSVNEGSNLNFLVTATDPDGTTPTLSSSTLPTGSTYTLNGNGTATFNWTPTFLQSGSYPVTYRATDGTLTDSEVVTITVSNVNLAPVLAAIGPKSGNEGVLLTFNLSASDPDLTTPALNTFTLPSGATFVDHGDGTGTFNWTPNFTQAGSYPITFRAADGVLIDTEIVTVSVNDVNQPPVLAPIGLRLVVEAFNLNFNISATDPDGAIPSLSTTTLPFGAGFTDNGNGTGTFDWTPTFTQSGIYLVTFRATDGTLVDTEIVTLSVIDAGNQAPVLATIGPQSTLEGVALDFNISATDADGPAVNFTTSTVPTGATFTDHANGTGTFNWTPTFAQSGTYRVTFRATDGALFDTEIVTITVVNFNQPPVWSAAADTVILEGTLLSRVLLATDADGQVPQLSSGPLPTGATFVDSGNGRGQFTFAPSFVQAGLYPFSFFATDGLITDTLAFVVAVSEAGGQAPIFDSIGAKTVNEGALLAVRVVARDPEGTAVTMVASGLPPNASFVDSGSGVGGLVFVPSFVQAGSYTIHILATDQGVPPLTRIQPVSITVQDANQAPVLDSIGPKYAVIEKAFAFDVKASDSTAPSGNVLIFTTLGLPAGATFVDSGNGHGRFSWTPTAGQVGTHNVTFTVIDNGAPALNDQEVVQISVISANHIPVLAAIGPKFVTEGQTLQFVISATDADATLPSFVMVNHPPTATLVDHGDGTATFTYVPQFVESGLRSVEFRASDLFSFDKEIVLIQVQEAGNQPPTALVVGPPSRFERDTLVATVRANDPDSTSNPLTMVSPLPANATFVDNGNGTATFRFVPWFTQQGAYSLIFATSDGTHADSVTYSFNILDVGNQTPFLHALGNPLLAVPDKTFREELRDSLFVAASDFDSTGTVLRATGLPAGSTFIDGGNNVGRMVWKPTFSQAGLYQVTVFARDTRDTTLFDSQLVSLTVNNFFPAPVWNPAIVKNYIVAEGTTLNLILASIPIDTVPRFKANHKPVNSTLTDNGNGTCQFNFQPSFFQSGVDSAVLIAYHPLDTAVQTPLVLKFTITNVPQAPIWRLKNDTSVTENVQLALIVTADDPDNTVPTLTAQNLPAGATFSIPFQGGGSATGRVSWMPTFAQQGIYPIRFLASDGVGVDTLVVTVTVLDAGNQTPVFTIPPVDQALILPVTYAARVRAVDADATIPGLRAERLPRHATFVDSGNGSGGFFFVPDTTQTDSVYAVDFFASDGVSQLKVTVTYSVFNFIRGDTNRDTKITSADVIYLVNYVFKGGTPPVPVLAGDADKSGTINSSDVIYLVNYLFKSGPPPPP